MRTVAKILHTRASKHSCNFCEQFEERPNFATTFKLNETILHPLCVHRNVPFQKYSLMECIPRWQFFQNHFQQPHNLKGKKQKQLLYSNQAQESFWGILALSHGNHLSEAWSVLPQLRANIPQYSLDKLNW